MLKRCYSEKYHKDKPTYIKCEVCSEWHNFQNFAKWCEENYIKQVADEYYNKNLIPKKLYDSMYNYKVEIND